MRNPSSLLLAILISLGASSLIAQLAPGDIGVTWLSTSQFSVFHASGTSTIYNVGSFQGTGNTGTIFLDPQVPNSFLIGGQGFLGRATITGANTATYSLITNAVDARGQISWDGSRLVVIDYGADQVVFVDPATGVVTPLTSGPQPWGVDLNSGTIDPSTGRIFCGGNNGIWMIPPGSSTPVPYASGWAAASAYTICSGITIDPITSEPIASLLYLNRVVRVTAGGTLIALATISGPNAIEPDANGDFIVGASFGNLYRVPRLGGTPVLLGVAGGVIGAATGVSPSLGTFRTYLTPRGSGAATLALSGIPAGTIEGWTLPSFDVSLPVGGGPILGLSPDALTYSLIAASPTAQPGDVFHWTWPVPASLYPASPLSFPIGTFPPTLSLDVISLAILPSSFLATPVRRIVFF